MTNTHPSPSRRRPVAGRTRPQPLILPAITGKSIVPASSSRTIVPNHTPGGYPKRHHRRSDTQSIVPFIVPTSSQGHQNEVVPRPLRGDNLVPPSKSAYPHLQETS